MISRTFITALNKMVYRFSNKNYSWAHKLYLYSLVFFVDLFTNENLSSVNTWKHDWDTFTNMCHVTELVSPVCHRNNFLFHFANFKTTPYI